MKKLFLMGLCCGCMTAGFAETTTDVPVEMVCHHHHKKHKDDKDRQKEHTREVTKERGDKKKGVFSKETFREFSKEETKTPNCGGCGEIGPTETDLLMDFDPQVMNQQPLDTVISGFFDLYNFYVENNVPVKPLGQYLEECRQLLAEYNVEFSETGYYLACYKRMLLNNPANLASLLADEEFMEAVRCTAKKIPPDEMAPEMAAEMAAEMGWWAYLFGEEEEKK